MGYNFPCLSARSTFPERLLSTIFSACTHPTLRVRLHPFPVVLERLPYSTTDVREKYFDIIGGCIFRAKLQENVLKRTVLRFFFWNNLDRNRMLRSIDFWNKTNLIK